MKTQMQSPQEFQTSRPAPPTAATNSGGQTDTSVVALVSAVRDELDQTILRLGLQQDPPWYIGQVGNQKVVAALTGMGGRRAVEVFATMLDEHRPSHVIHLGFAGGLNPTIRAGSVVNVAWVIDGKGGVMQLDGGVPHPGTLPSDDVARGNDTLLTVDHLVHNSAEKGILFVRHHAAVVDMETYHLARLAAQRNVSMTVLRAVSDPAAMSIPPETENWVNPDGSHRIVAAITHLATHPWKIAGIIQLARNVKLASRNLAQRVHRHLSEPATE